MAKQMLAAPRIAQKGVPGFLLWTRRDSPALYASLLREFPEVQEFDSALNAQGVSGMFSNIGSSLASAAGKIGTFVKNNALPILSAAVPVIVAKKQADVAMTQFKLAAAQQAPAQTAYTTTTDGSVIAVPIQRTAGATLRSAGVPSWVWIGGAGAAALLMLFMFKRR